jgi:hypothetical protein
MGDKQPYGEIAVGENFPCSCIPEHSGDDTRHHEAVENELGMRFTDEEDDWYAKDIRAKVVWFAVLFWLKDRRKDRGT